MNYKPKNKAAQELARLRSESLTPERRSEIARNAQKFSVISRNSKKGALCAKPQTSTKSA